MSTAQTLFWDDVISIDTVPDAVTLTDTTGFHKVRVEVPLADIQARFGWRRDDGTTRPVGYWKTGEVTTLFDLVGNANGVVNLNTKVDLTPTTLNFTSADLDLGFAVGTANDFVVPYVLDKIFGNSGVMKGVVPSYQLLVDGDPLLSTSDFSAAFSAQIVTSTDGVGAVSYAANSLFQELLTKDIVRFNGTDALTISDVWTQGTVTSDSLASANPWGLLVGDIIQFTVKFTFASSITSTQGSILGGETYSINLQLHITA